MLHSVRYLLGLCVLSQLFFACKKEDEKITPPTSQSGYFVVSSLEQSTANGRRAVDTYNSEFDLGKLQASDKFLFMIANGGDEPIFDVTLTSDNTPFEISPKNIKVVPGRKGSAIVPLLTVAVTHGWLLKGVGPAPRLLKGENKAIIRMTGKTLSKKDTIEVTGEFVVKVDALVMEAKFFSAGMEAILGTSEGWRNQLMLEPSKGVKIINTGNVLIQAKLRFTITHNYDPSGMGEYTHIENLIEIQPGEEKDITNYVSPARGEAILDNRKVLYSGYTSVSLDPMKNPGVVTTKTDFEFMSK